MYGLAKVGVVLSPTFISLTRGWSLVHEIVDRNVLRVQGDTVHRSYL
jgi:hypothetical protein